MPLLCTYGVVTNVLFFETSCVCGRPRQCGDAAAAIHTSSHITVDVSSQTVITAGGAVSALWPHGHSTRWASIFWHRSKQRLHPTFQQPLHVQPAKHTQYIHATCQTGATQWQLPVYRRRQPHSKQPSPAKIQLPGVMSSGYKPHCSQTPTTGCNSGQQLQP